MKKLLESRGVRVLAFVLCLIFGMLTVCTGAAAVYVYYEPGLQPDAERDFYSSELAAAFVNRYEWAAIDIYRSTGEAYRPTGYSYIIRQGDEVLIDTTVPQSMAVSQRQYGNDHWGLQTEDVLTIESYVNFIAGQRSPLNSYVALYDFLYNNRGAFLPWAIAAAVVTLLLFVFLMAAAGRTPEGVRLGGLHRWPLEIYGGALILGGVAALVYFDEAFNYWNAPDAFTVAGMGALILAMGTAVLLFCMTLAARLRAGKWWRNTLTFMALRLLWRGCRWVWRILRGAVRALPVAWKLGLAWFLAAFLNFILTLCVVESRDIGVFWLFLLLLLDAAILVGVLLLGAQMKKLQAAGRALAAGDLSYTVDTRSLWLDLKEHGENLNAVSLGMSRAVNERMKSERFKTELITNVSHDLKTPLTSIVNYVDLLKKEEIDNAQAREYIGVLDRQAQRLRKLTCDLVDASKASSGALPVNLETLDLKELVQQTVGEYAERLALAEVEPVVSLPEESCVVRADGRLLWRVLDNLFLNVTKYALGGTRFYADLRRTGEGTELALKNISRQALNIPAEELLERFVRGDASRSTEGSGLGLSIARSLMELMGGTLELSLDGDLFKVTLRFPGQ